MPCDPTDISWERAEAIMPMRIRFPVIYTKKCFYQPYNVILQVNQEQCNTIMIKTPYLYLSYVPSYVVT